MKATLLTQDVCDLCEQAKAILELLRSEFDFEVELVDLATESGRELAERAGILFPPGLLLDGEPFSYGRVSERKLRKELVRRVRALR